MVIDSKVKKNFDYEIIADHSFVAFDSIGVIEPSFMEYPHNPLVYVELLDHVKVLFLELVIASVVMVEECVTKHYYFTLSIDQSRKVKILTKLNKKHYKKK